MTRLDPILPYVDLNTALAQMTADFGKWRVLVAVLRHLFVRKSPAAMRAPPLLDAHMRKDIGLPPLSDQPPERLFFHF